MRRASSIGVLLVVTGALTLWIVLRGGDERTSAGIAPRAAPQAEQRAASVEAPEVARATAASSPIVEERIESELHPWRARAFGRVVEYASGAPVANATVEFDTHAEDGGALTRSALTDAQGRVELDDLHLRGANPPKIALALRVRASGYVPFFANAYATRPPRDPSETLEFALGDLRLSRGTLVAGRVVRAANGAGVEGATIHFAELRSVQEDVGGGACFTDRFPRELGVSDADGRFELREPVPALSPEAYLFAASEQGVGWTRIAVVEGRARIDDVELKLYPPRALAIQVVDARGEAVHGAELLLKPQGDPLAGLARLAVHPRAEGAHAWGSSFQGRTDELGEWRAAHLPAQRGGDVVWTLAVSAEDGRTTRVAVNPTAPGAPPRRIVLPDGESRALAGRVVDARKRPFAGARVELDERVVHTDGEGRFRVEFARGSSESSEYVRLQVSGAGIAAHNFVFPVRDLASEELELVLQHAAPIAGLVTDQAGRALAGVELLLQSFDPVRWKQSWTDAHGRFRIEDAPEGESRLVGPDAVLGNREPVNAIAVRGGDEAVHLVCDMRPEPCGRLALRVVDAITGVPLAPIEVVLSRRGTDERGAFYTATLPLTRTLGLVNVDELPAGTWGAEVYVENGGWSRVDVEVLAGVLNEAQLLVGLGGSVAGRVIAEASLEGAWVVIESERGRPQPRAVGLPNGGNAAIDPATGGFRLDGLDPGDYTLELRGSALHARAVATVHAGEVAQVELTAQLPARLRVVSDVPWEGGTLGLRVWSGERICANFNHTIARDAHVDFELVVEPGPVRWELQAQASPSHRPASAPPPTWSGEATLGAGELHTVRLDAPR